MQSPVARDLPSGLAPITRRICKSRPRRAYRAGRSRRTICTRRSGIALKTLRTCRPDQANPSLRAGQQDPLCQRRGRACPVRDGAHENPTPPPCARPLPILVSLPTPLTDFEPLPARRFEDDRHRLRAVPRKEPHRHYQPPVDELLAQITSHEPQIRPDHLLGALPCLLELTPFVWVPTLAA